jgi:GntR family transcriptional regulator
MKTENVPLRSGRPRHEQVSTWLRDRIESGRYGPDDQLPSESRLVDRFGVSRITVRRALQTLESDGLIYRRQGLGSFVRGERVRQGLVRLTDFAEDMESAGLHASSRVENRAIEPATDRIATALGVEAGAPVLRLDRLRLGNGEPIAFDRTWLPLFYAQLLDGRDLGSETIYQILERDGGITMERGRFRFEAVNAPSDVGRALAVPWGRALLLVERVTYAERGRCVYFQQRFYRSDRVAYELDLEREPGARGPGLPIREFEPVFKPTEGAA